MTPLRISLLFLLFSLVSLKGDEITAPIFSLKRSEDARVLPEKVKPLILFLQELQANDFITSGDASDLKWKLSRVVLIADNIISVSFDEGHIGVTGVLELDDQKKKWVIKIESGGKFKHQVYSSLTGKPK